MSIKFSISKLRHLLVFAVPVLAMLVLLLPSPIFAQTQSNWRGTMCVSDGQNVGAGDVATIQGLQCLIANVLFVAVRFIGLAGFVMFIFGAFRYMVSGGNSKETQGARDTITWAIIGLVVALSAVLIMNLLAAFTGIDTLTQFSIPASNTP